MQCVHVSLRCVCVCARVHGRLVVNAMAGLFLGVWGYRLSLLYTASCAVVFMARTLGSLTRESISGREQRNHLLMGCVLVASYA
jgi:hypothetical protein